MAEKIGVCICPVRGCRRTATFSVDKRGKYFVTCPTHGRLVGSTHESQAWLKSLLDAGEVFESVDELREWEKAGHEPAKPEKSEAPEPEKARKSPEKSETEDEQGGRAGLVLLGLAGVGLAAGLMMKRGVIR